MASESVFSILGAVFSILVFASPGIIFVAKGDVVRYSPYPYAITAANCAVWIVYAARSPADTHLVIFANSIGVALQLLYLVLFFCFSPADDRRRAPLMGLVPGAFLVFATGFIFNDTLFGYYAAVCGVAVYGPPLYGVYTVIVERRGEYMPPFPVAAVSLLNAIFWASFAIFRKNRFMLVPNVAGVVASLLQLSLHTLYFFRTGRFADTQDDDDGLRTFLRGMFAEDQEDQELV